MAFASEGIIIGHIASDKSIIIGRNFENQRWVHGAGGAGDGGGSNVNNGLVRTPGIRLGFQIQ